LDTFDYSKEFEELIIRLHRGKEDWPGYQKYLKAHLGGPTSRIVKFKKQLCRDIEFHCGSLKDKRILDFGCGTGATTVALAEHSTQICAFDIDRESFEICRKRIREHGLEGSVQFYSGDDLDKIKDSMGTFDLILLNGVIEHIPLTKTGLRKKIIRSLFTLLKRSGYLFINETPNRLCPFDGHSTQLWWIPWMKPGSDRAYRRAVKKKRHSAVPTTSEGPLGLEEVGAWGATYWEIMSYLSEESFLCLNTMSGHNRHVQYFSPGSWKRSVFESVAYWSAVKLLHIPITAFSPVINNLVIQKR
jgi:2-polyprenyl-3-methyl-5-hydroxy-6-metoxy-1,4-benzoquinol methylase